MTGKTGSMQPTSGLPTIRTLRLNECIAQLALLEQPERAVSNRGTAPKIPLLRKRLLKRRY